ncbi:hypothetical protein K438DRAFT_1753953 [Mycena galopus ATCC 62051]|nr:hypothetical protein K438DRAFT_1753953 [Mycena galopus ATCC 62051]
MTQTDGTDANGARVALGLHHLYKLRHEQTRQFAISRPSGIQSIEFAGMVPEQSWEAKQRCGHVGLTDDRRRMSGGTTLLEIAFETTKSFDVQEYSNVPRREKMQAPLIEFSKHVRRFPSGFPKQARKVPANLTVRSGATRMCRSVEQHSQVVPEESWSSNDILGRGRDVGRQRNASWGKE